MNLTSTKFIGLATVLVLSGQKLNAQCAPLPSAVADITLQCSLTQGGNPRTGLAYYPTENQYYSVNGGTTTFPIECFSGNGAALTLTTQGVDYRGFWYNPNALTMEGNTYNSNGIYAHLTNSATGYPTGATNNVAIGNMPDQQSCGAYDMINNHVLYYDAGTIYKYSRVTGLLISSVPITGMPSGSINSYGIGYTGLPGAEVCVYDYTNRRVNFINYTTGAYVSFCQLPPSAPTPGSYETAFTHNRMFLYDDNTNRWYGYKVTNQTDIVFQANNIACSGASSPIGISGANSYSWSTGSTSPVISVSPAVTSTYAVMATNLAGCSNISNFILTVIPTPSVSASSNQTLVCGPGAATLTATGAANYTWSVGPAFTSTVEVFPTPSMNSFSVIGSNDGICFSMDTVSVAAEDTPVVNLTAGSPSLCSGSTVTLSATGAATYSWSGSASTGSVIVVTPTTTANYLVTGYSQNGCSGAQSSASVSIQVVPAAVLNAGATASLICPGQSSNLSVNGANSYVWMPGNVSGSAISVAPSSTTIYTVTGSTSGCPGMAMVTVSVGTCTSLDENSANGLNVAVWPNPNNGIFHLKGNSTTTLQLVNSLGQHLQTIRLTETNNYTVVIENLADGIYFLTGGSSGTQKIVVTR